MAIPFNDLPAEDQARIIASAYARVKAEAESEERARLLAQKSLADYMEELIAASARAFGYTIAIPVALIMDLVDFATDTWTIVKGNTEEGWNAVMDKRAQKRALKIEKRQLRQGS